MEFRFDPYELLLRNLPDEGKVHLEKITTKIERKIGLMNDHVPKQIVRDVSEGALVVSVIKTVAEMCGADLEQLHAFALKIPGAESRMQIMYHNLNIVDSLGQYIHASMQELIIDYDITMPAQGEIDDDDSDQLPKLSPEMEQFRAKLEGLL